MALGSQVPFFGCVKLYIFAYRSRSVKQPVRYVSLSVCPSTHFELNNWRWMILPDTVEVKCEKQGHQSEFTVTTGEYRWTGRRDLEWRLCVIDYSVNESSGISIPTLPATNRNTGRQRSGKYDVTPLSLNNASFHGYLDLGPWFLRPTWLYIPWAISKSSAVFAQLRVVPNTQTHTDEHTMLRAIIVA